MGKHFDEPDRKHRNMPC